MVIGSSLGGLSLGGSLGVNFLGSSICPLSDIVATREGVGCF